MRNLDKAINSLINEAVTDISKKVIDALRDGEVQKAFEYYTKSPTGKTQGIPRSVKTFLSTVKGKEFAEGDKLKNLIDFARLSPSFRVGVTDREITKRAEEVSSGSFEGDNSGLSGRKKIETIDGVKAREINKETKTIKGSFSVSERMVNVLSAIENGKREAEEEIKNLEKIQVSDPNNLPKIKEACKIILRIWFPPKATTSEDKENSEMDKSKFTQLKNEAVGSEGPTVERTFWKIAYDNHKPNPAEARAVVNAIIKTKREGIEILNNAAEGITKKVSVLDSMSKEDRQKVEASLLSSSGKKLLDLKRDNIAANPEAVNILRNIKTALEDIEKEKKELESIYKNVPEISIKELKEVYDRGVNLLGNLIKKESERVKQSTAKHGFDKKENLDDVRSKYDTYWKRWSDVAKMKLRTVNKLKRKELEASKDEAKEREENLGGVVGKKVRALGGSFENEAKIEKDFKEQENARRTMAFYRTKINKLKRQRKEARTEQQRNDIENKIKQNSAYFKTFQDKYNTLAEKTKSVKIKLDSEKEKEE